MAQPVQSDVAPRARDQPTTPGLTLAGEAHRRVHGALPDDRHRHLATVTRT